MDVFSDFVKTTKALFNFEVNILDAVFDFLGSIHEQSKASFQQSMPRKPPTVYQIRVLLQLLKDSIVEGDATSVSDRYTSNAVLVPFDSDEPLVGQEAILDYYQKFITHHKPLFVKVLHGSVTFPHRYGSSCCCVAQDNGVYDIMTYAGELLRMQYNIVYVRENSGRWRIVHHNSKRIELIPQDLLAMPFLEDEKLRAWTLEAKKEDKSTQAMLVEEPLSSPILKFPLEPRRSIKTNDRIVDLLTGAINVVQDDKSLLGTSDHSKKND